MITLPINKSEKKLIAVSGCSVACGEDVADGLLN